MCRVISSMTQREFLEKLIKSTHFRIGLPFFILVIVGSLEVKEFASLRYHYRKIRSVDREDLERMRKPRGSVTLESEYEKIKNLDIDNWENKRGPRLFEEPASP